MRSTFPLFKTHLDRFSPVGAGVLAVALALCPAAVAQSTDLAAPTVTSVEIDLATVTATTAQMVVTFNEPVTGVDASDFVLSGTPNAAATITGVTAGATTAVYSVAFTYTGTSGSLQMAIKSSGTGIADLGGNAFIGRGVAASEPVSVNNAPPADMTPPAVTGFAAASGAITSPASLTLVFSEPVTGVSADDFVVSAGATIGAVTGSGTTWTVPVTFSGTSAVSVTVLGGATSNIRDAATHWLAGGNAAASVTFAPGAVGGSTPAITSPLTASVAAGANFSYTITASNAPTALSAIGLPAGLAFVSPVVSGSVATPGVYNITVSATNASGSATENLVLTVTPVGHSGTAPAITSPLTATATAGTSFSYTIRATNTPTAFTATGLPAGLTFASPVISGTVATPGAYPIVIGANNAAGSDRETLVLTVNRASRDDDDDDDKKDKDDKGSGRVTVLKLRGEATTLPATTSDGKAITWVLVSGNATLVGNVLTPKNNGAVVVRAYVAGSLSPVVDLDVAKEDEKDKGKPKAAHKDRLSNLSSRVKVYRDHPSRAAIAGFVVEGLKPKQVLIRAVGPGLLAFGLRDTPGAVRLRLHHSSGAVMAENDGWKADAAIAAAAGRVGAFPLGITNHDSALLVTLAPGSYTAQVSGSADGIALIEVYDATSASELSTEQLINISTRGHVGTGDANLVGGFIVTGDAPKRVLIRGVGPGLAAYGVTDAAADPVLELYSTGGTTLLASNDNWEASLHGTPATEVEAAARSTGAFALARGSKDAAIVITLMPGAYSAVVKGANGTTGTGLVEVYELRE